jgi:hypothetical protein
MVTATRLAIIAASTKPRRPIETLIARNNTASVESKMHQGEAST